MRLNTPPGVATSARVDNGNATPACIFSHGSAANFLLTDVMALMITATPEFATESTLVIVAIHEVWMR